MPDADVTMLLRFAEMPLSFHYVFAYFHATLSQSFASFSMLPLSRCFHAADAARHAVD